MYLESPRSWDKVKSEQDEKLFVEYLYRVLSDEIYRGEIMIDPNYKRRKANWNVLGEADVLIFHIEKKVFYIFEVKSAYKYKEVTNHLKRTARKQIKNLKNFVSQRRPNDRVYWKIIYINRDSYFDPSVMMSNSSDILSKDLLLMPGNLERITSRMFLSENR